MQAHVLRTWAADAAAFAEALARQDPRWGAMTFPLADGFGVLCGPGMYVNVAMAVGIERDVTADEFESFEARCARVGVDPAIEVSPLTLPAVRSAAAERGYELSASRSALRRRLDDLDPERSAETSFVIEPAGDQLDGWRETAAAGWGHDTPARRRASDAFAGAAAEVDGDGLVLARDVESGTTVACASLTIRDDIATWVACRRRPRHGGRERSPP